MKYRPPFTWVQDIWDPVTKEMNQIAAMNEIKA